jgi:putative oxidoreductase
MADVGSTTESGRVDGASTRVLEGVTGADVGLLVLRLGLGVVFLGHGLQKLGWFPGGGYPTSMSEQKAFLVNFGYSSPSLMAWLLTVTEIVAGVSLLLGLLTPLGSAAVIGIMWQFVAGLQWGGGLFGNSTTGGFEQSLIGLVAAVALAYVGPGRLSVDHALGLKLSGLRWGSIGVALGIVVGSIVLVAFGSGFGGAPPPVIGPG